MRSCQYGVSIKPRISAAGICLVAMTVAAVKPCARSFSQPPPAGEKTAHVLAGIRREGRGQVKGLHWSAADTVAVVAANGGRGSLAGLRDAALVPLASDCLLRLSEAVAVQLADLTVEPDGSGRLTVHRSKTDQEGKGAVLYVGEATMRRIAAWRDAVGLDDGPLFRRIRRGDKVQTSAITAVDHPDARRRGRDRGARVRPQSADRRGTAPFCCRRRAGRASGGWPMG